MNLFGQMQLLQDPDAVPVQVNLIPAQAVARRSGMGVMIVVPAFAEREHGHHEVIRGGVAGNETARAPDVRCRIHQPSGMQTQSGAQEDSPEYARKAAMDAAPECSAKSVQKSRQDDDGYVMIFGDPYMKLVFGQIRHVTRKRR